MLVRAQVVYNPSPLLAENHVGVKTPRLAGGKVANPGYGLSPVFVDICIVSDGEVYCAAALRKHDATHAPEIEKGQGVGFSVPKLVHGSSADTCEIVATAKSEPFLNTRMKKLKFFTQCLFVDRLHGSVSPWSSTAVLCGRQVSRDQQSESSQHCHCQIQGQRIECGSQIRRRVD